MLNAIILAAGRGSRLKGLTVDRPKCLNIVAGRPLLEWQLAALRKAGINSIIPVTGYHREMIEAYNLPTVHNADWESTNMVFSLYCAILKHQGPILISYSDILYSADAIQTLLADAGPEISILYDKDWKSLWEARSTSPLNDTESFIIDNGKIREIGRPVKSMDEPQGQYMGLLHFSATAVKAFAKFALENQERIRKLDMTSLLRIFIESGVEVKGIPTTGNWCEVDTEADLALAEKMFANGKLRLEAI